MNIFNNFLDIVAYISRTKVPRTIPSVEGELYITLIIMSVLFVLDSSIWFVWIKKCFFKFYFLQANNKIHITSPNSIINMVRLDRGFMFVYVAYNAVLSGEVLNVIWSNDLFMICRFAIFSGMCSDEPNIYKRSPHERIGPWMIWPGRTIGLRYMYVLYMGTVDINLFSALVLLSLERSLFCLCLCVFF